MRTSGPELPELDPLAGVQPRTRSKWGWTILRVGLGGLVALAGLVALVGSVDTDEPPVVGCGGPAFSVAFGGGHHPAGRESDCRAAGGDQSLGGGLFLVGGGCLLLGPRVRRWTRARSRRRRGSEETSAPAPSFEAPVGPLDTLRLVEDPGWRPALIALVPIVGIRIAAERRRQHPNGLIVIRQLFLSFAASIVMFAFVITQLDLARSDASASSRTVMLAIGAIALVDLAFGRLLVRPLDGSTEARLVATWRTRFFIRIAFAEVPALLGFVGAFLAGSPSPYFLGAAATALLLVRAAPTAGNIARDQEALRDQSSALSVLAVLTGWSPKLGNRV